MPRSIRVFLLLCAAALLSACQALNLRDKAPANGHPAATDSEVAAAAAPRMPGTRQAPSAPQVSFLLGQDQPASNLARLSLSPTQSIYVLPQPVLTRADLARVEPFTNSNNQSFVVFTFSARGAQKLAAISQHNAGHYLVVTVNDTLVALPRIAAPLNDGVLGVPVADPQTAHAIASAVAGQ